VLHSQSISSSLTWSLYLYLAKCTSYETPHCANFSSLLPFHPLFGPNILLSILFSNTSSLCFSLNVNVYNYVSAALNHFLKFWYDDVPEYTELIVIRDLKFSLWWIIRLRYSRTWGHVVW
jgi:hypothetical protein